jgi:tRNA (cmo5U34)-methyltransferase
MGTDQLFDSSECAKEFVFDENVAEVFDDMVERSVPFYHEIQRMVVELAAGFLGGGDKIFDLGCSTATTLCLLAGSVADPGVELIGIDNSAAMLKKARDKARVLGLSDRIKFIRQDLSEPVDFSSAGVVIMNWTLQFVRPPAASH